MTGDERRLKLFDLYSANWALVHPRHSWDMPIPEEYNRAVACPMCLELFNQSSLDQRLKNPLSLEHIPPSKLGGRARILTCKRCNNESGLLLDSAVSQFIELAPFMRRHDSSGIEGITSLNHSGGKKINSRTVMRIVGKDRLIFNARIPKGEWREKQFEAIDPAAPIRIGFKFSVPSRRRVHIALLRIAYLQAFSKFGHDFILNREYNALRYQIMNPNEKVLELAGTMVSTKIIVADGMYVVNTPGGMTSLLVVFTLKRSGETHKAIVFLPSPFTDSVEYYQKFYAFGANKFQIDTRERFLDVDFLTDLNYVFSFRKRFVDLKT